MMFHQNAYNDIMSSRVRASFSYSSPLKNILGYHYLPVGVHSPAERDSLEATGDAESARTYIQQGQPEKALAEIEKAEAAAKPDGSPRLQASLLDVKGAAYMSAGEFEKAIDAYRQAMVLEKSQNDLDGQAEMFLRTAWAYQSMYDSTNALQCYQAAIEFFEKSGNKEGVVRAKLGMRTLHQSMRDFDYVTSNMDWIGMGASREQAAGVMAGDGQVLLSKFQPERASYRYKDALAVLAPSSDSALQASVFAGLGRADMAVGFCGEAERRLKAAQSKVPSGNRDSQAAILASLGDVQLSLVLSPSHANQRSAVKAALKWYGEALPLMRATWDRNGEIGVLSGMGAAFEISKDSSQALSAYMEAIAALESLTQAARLQEFRSESSQQLDGVYERAVVTAMKEGRPEEAFDLTERARITGFLNAFGNARVDARLHLAPEFGQQERELRNQHILVERQLGQEIAKPDQDVNAERVVYLRTQLEAIRKEYRGLGENLRSSAPNYAPYPTLFPCR